MKSLDKNKILKLFHQGLSCTKIAKELKVSTATISARLKSLGEKVTNKQNEPRINDKLGEEIIKLYTSEKKLSIREVYDTINVNMVNKIPMSSIYKFLHKSGIPVINYQNRTKFNECVFDNINTEEKAYWLGFIYADGYISSRDNTFELSLKASDSEHLVKFNTFMEYDGMNIKYGKIKERYERCRWSITNKHLWTTLNNYGCTPRKSLTLKFPNILSNDLLIPFIRGYFDGDGCITFIRNKSNIVPIANMIGTNDFLQTIKETLSKLGCCPQIRSDKRYNDNIKVLYFPTQDNIKFLNIIYNKASIYLDRKYKRYKFLKNSPSNEELLEFLAGENGEVCDDNAVVT